MLTAEEEQRLEEGMRHQMVDAGRKRPAAIFPDTTMVRFGGFTGGGPADIGHALFTTYLLPFEVTSILILVAIIGAIVLARKEIE